MKYDNDWVENLDKNINKVRVVMKHLNIGGTLIFNNTEIGMDTKGRIGQTVYVDNEPFAKDDIGVNSAVFISLNAFLEYIYALSDDDIFDMAASNTLKMEKRK